MRSAFLLEVFEYMLLLLLTNNFRICEQQLGYRNQSSCRYTVLFMKEIIMQYNMKNSNIHCAIRFNNGKEKKKKKIKGHVKEEFCHHYYLIYI